MKNWIMELCNTQALYRATLSNLYTHNKKRSFLAEHIIYSAYI